MKEWELIYPIKPLGLPLPPFWKDISGKHLVIPSNNSLKRWLMQIWHNAPTAGHPGWDETTRRINHKYYWPGAHSWVDDYIKGCATCQQNKNLMHRLKTLLYRIPSEPSAKLFSHVAMDLITGLPNSKGYDAILTIIDHRCSKAQYSFHAQWQLEDPRLLNSILITYIDGSDYPNKSSVIEIHNSHPHFSHAITKELGIHQNLSIAFHPQTDGLSEWKNQWIEQYLCLITMNQEDWSDWLAITTLVHNNLVNSTTRFMPSELLIG